jgi:hypothetical protein
LREVLRGEELPAQWQKYPLKTQQEMMSGRDALGGHAMWRWADEGVTWLNEQFRGKGLEFATSVDVEAREVRLAVWRHYSGAIPAEELFSVVEPIENFVSHLTVTKIILIAG